jgi:predicted Zn-dependent peptidase
MASLKNRKVFEICENVNFIFLHEPKFKTTKISFIMSLPLDEKTVSQNAVFPNILVNSCQKYPTLKLLNYRLEELYGTNISAEIDKFGEIQTLTICADFMNDEFAFDNMHISSNISELLCEIIFNPNIENGSFKKFNFEQERRQLIESIEAEYNNKKIYAKNRCIELMCKSEKFGINEIGTIEGAKNLIAENVFLAWQNALKTAKIEILMVGNSNYEPFLEKFKQFFSKIQRNTIPKYSTKIILHAEKINEYKDFMDVTQCKIVMGFRTGIAIPNEKVENMQLMCALFGVTPRSKLFLNVREKLGLCYYCSEKYHKFKGVLFVESGVEPKNLYKAKKEILKQLKAMQNGDFTETDLSETKTFLIQMLQKTNDSISLLSDWYIGQMFADNIKSPEETAKIIENVSKNDVISAANQVFLDTIYVLAQKGNE